MVGLAKTKPYKGVDKVRGGCTIHVTKMKTIFANGDYQMLTENQPVSPRAASLDQLPGLVSLADVAARLSRSQSTIWTWTRDRKVNYWTWAGRHFYDADGIANLKAISERNRRRKTLAQRYSTVR